MNTAGVTARLIDSRRRIDDSLEMLDRASRCLNRAERRALDRRQASPDLYRAAFRIAVNRTERAAQGQLRRLYRRADAAHLGLH